MISGWIVDGVYSHEASDAGDAPGRDIEATGALAQQIGGSNAFHWVFRSGEAVIHRASPTRGAVVVRETMGGHWPAVWISDRYTAQQGHGVRHETCLAHLARDVAYAVELSADPGSFGCSPYSHWPSASPI